jgi:2-keto-4-pentenoate hydratase
LRCNVVSDVATTRIAPKIRPGEAGHARASLCTFWIEDAREFPMTWSEDVARAIYEAHRLGLDFSPLRQGGSALSERTAYEVQDHLVARLCADLRSDVAGYKIGLTSPAMQKMCGMATPVYGRILSTRVQSGDVHVDPARHRHLGVEFEIAVRIGKDVTAPPQTWSALDEYVDGIAPSFELVDDRHANYAHLDGASLVADNAWNAGIVLGPWQSAPPDLQSRRGRVFCDGVQVDEGRVGDALEHPFASVHWLAGELARRGHVLRAGMVVMTGSIVRTRFPSVGQHWQYEVDGLGSVRASFASA